MPTPKINPVTGLTMSDCAFIEAYQRLGNAAKAYSELHPGATEGTCKQGSNAKLKKPPIIAYLAKTQERASIVAACTLADHLRTLQGLCAAALRAGNHRAAIYAEELRGKASGHYQVNVNLRHSLSPAIIAAIPWDQLNEQELAEIEAGKASDELIDRLITSARTATVSSSS